ncbi:MAG: SAM-dependent methyltransferase [Acidobacteriota bacterium]
MDERWYESFFDRRYLDFYPSLRSAPIASDDATFVARVLELEPGASLLDLGCGTGRHSVALAQLGLRVTGLDLSEDLLAQARATEAASGIAVSWIQRDMRELDGLGPFDAVVSLHTAFGFLGEEEDRRVLAGVARILRKRGRFLLDVTNFLGYLTRFPAEVWHESQDAVHRERNRYEPERGVLVTERTAYLKQGGTLELPASHVRAYLPHELRTMLGAAGFEIEAIYGALSPLPFHWQSSPNQVFLCQLGSRG